MSTKKIELKIVEDPRISYRQADGVYDEDLNGRIVPKGFTIFTHKKSGKVIPVEYISPNLGWSKWKFHQQDSTKPVKIGNHLYPEYYSRKVFKKNRNTILTGKIFLSPAQYERNQKRLQKKLQEDRADKALGVLPVLSEMTGISVEKMKKRIKKEMQ